MRERIQADGLELVVQTHGRGPDVVFAHGLSSNRNVTLRQLRPLARHRRVVAFDQRGHGDSTVVRDPRLFDLKLMAADIALVMDQLGIRSAVVGGESMGAATALAFALRHPDRVKALLLTGPAFGDRPHHDPQIVQRMAEQLESLGMSGFLRASAEEMRREGVVPEKGIRFLTRFRGVHDTVSLTLACRAVIDWVVFKDMEDLRVLDLPVCILCWPNDALHPLGLAERMAAALPQARLIRLPSIAEILVDPLSVGCRYRQFLAGLRL